MSKARTDEPDKIFQELYDRPGFLLRRGHQIATAAFVEACREVELTPTQYGVIFSLKHMGALDQSAIARLVGLDRSTTGLVVELLEKRGIVHRRRSETDLRKNELELTPAGRRLFTKAEGLAAQERLQLLSVLTPQERTEFIRLLGKFVDAFNDTSRVKVERPAARAATRKPRSKRIEGAR